MYSAGTTWLLTASLMLGDMFGLGQLTLPQVSPAMSHPMAIGTGQPCALTISTITASHVLSTAIHCTHAACTVKQSDCYHHALQTMSRLGYVPGGALLLLFCSLALYSGYLYQRLALLCPEAAMFDQVLAPSLG